MMWESGLEVDELDGGRSVVADARVAGSFDPVGVVAAAFDDAGVGAVPAHRVEVLFAGDVGCDAGQ
jgi:hypothetical protein